MLALLATGCASAVSLQDVEPGAPVQIALDASTRVIPAPRLKFWVVVQNGTGDALDLSDLSVELTARPAGEPDRVSLRKSWTWSWGRRVVLAPGRRLTVPIVPESRQELEEGLQRVVTISEFPLAELSPGPYEILARVNDRFTSRPYPVRILPRGPIARAEPRH